MKQRSIATLAIWLVAVAASLWLATRAPLLTDMSAFLPAHPSAEQQLLIANLERGASARLLLASVGGIQPDTGRKISVALADGWRGLPEVKTVSNGNLADFEAERARLAEWRYLLAPGLQAADFEPAALTTSLQRARGLLATSAGLFNREQILADPTGASLAVLALLDTAGGPSRRDGVWVAADQLLFVVHLVADGSDLDGQQAAMRAVQSLFDKTITNSGHPEAHLILAGVPRFAVESREEIRGDVMRLSTIGVGLVVTLLIIAFRSLRVLLIALVPLACAVIAGAAAVTTTFGTLHALTLGFGAALIGECVDYALYHLVHASGRSRREGAFWAPIRLGLFTSLVGFGALLWSHFPGLGQLAVFAMAGLTAGFLTTRFVLPLLTARGLPMRDFATGEARLSALFTRLRSLRSIAMFVVAIAIAVGIVRRDDIWDTDIASLNPVSRQAQELDARMRQALGGPDINTLVLVQLANDSQNADSTPARNAVPTDTEAQSNAEQAVLEATTIVTARLRAEVAAGRLAGVRSVTDLVPPVSLQRARQAMLPDGDSLRERLAALAPVTGLPVRSLQTFINDIAAARERAPLTIADYDDSALADVIANLWTEIDAHPTAIITLAAHADKTLDATSLRMTIGAIPDARVTVLDVKAKTDALYAGYINEALRLALGGALAIVVLLAVVLRSARTLLAVVLPITGAIALIVCGFTLSGHALNLLHLVGLLLVAAIGSNYALVLARTTHSIHSMHSDRSPETDADADTNATPSPVLIPLVLANLTTVAGFGVLAASKIPLLSALGLTVGLGAPLVLLLAAIGSNRAAESPEQSLQLQPNP